jgi:hypothetical protein
MDCVSAVSCWCSVGVAACTLGRGCVVPFPTRGVAILHGIECAVGQGGEAGGPYLSNEGTGLLLDASGSTDPDDDPLEYRWDLDSDGIWDTGWSTRARMATPPRYL